MNICLIYLFIEYDYDKVVSASAYYPHSAPPVVVVCTPACCYKSVLQVVITSCIPGHSSPTVVSHTMLCNSYE